MFVFVVLCPCMSFYLFVKKMSRVCFICFNMKQDIHYLFRALNGVKPTPNIKGGVVSQDFCMKGAGLWTWHVELGQGFYVDGDRNTVRHWMENIEKTAVEIDWHICAPSSVLGERPAMADRPWKKLWHVPRGGRGLQAPATSSPTALLPLPSQGLNEDVPREQESQKSLLDWNWLYRLIPAVHFCIFPRQNPSASV